LLKAAKIDPGRGLVWASIGKAYLQLEKYDKSITALKRSEGNWGPLPITTSEPVTSGRTG